MTKRKIIFIRKFNGDGDRDKVLQFISSHLSSPNFYVASDLENPFPNGTSSDLLKLQNSQERTVQFEDRVFESFWVYWKTVFFMSVFISGRVCVLGVLGYRDKRLSVLPLIISI